MGNRSKTSLVLALAILVVALQPFGFDAARVRADAPTSANTARRVRATTPATRRRPAPRPASVSLGLPFRGRIRNAIPLLESPTVRFAGEYVRGGNFYGTDELVSLLMRAADHVARRTRGGRLSVGELSKRDGGNIAGHRSHQNGRDVDIAFYMTDAGGHAFAPFSFANFDRNGVGLSPNESLRFDDVRNWELVARLLSDPDARVQYVFVANTLKARLLRTARNRGVAPTLYRRAELAMMQPTHGHPHRNHFHVRIYCPPGDRPLCADQAPFYPWYPGTPPTGPVAPTPTED